MLKKMGIILKKRSGWIRRLYWKGFTCFARIRFHLKYKYIIKIYKSFLYLLLSSFFILLNLFLYSFLLFLILISHILFKFSIIKTLLCLNASINPNKYWSATNSLNRRKISGLIQLLILFMCNQKFDIF